MSVRGNTAGEYFGEWFGPVEVVPGSMSANIGGSGTVGGTLTAQEQPPVNPVSGGGGGGRIRYQIIYPHTKRRGKTIDQKIGDWVEAIVAGEVEATPEVVQIRKVVAPYVHKDTIDLAAMQRDAKKLRALLRAYEESAMLDEEDELLMMIL